MKLPQDIQARLERRRLAHLNQDAGLRPTQRILNESEVTDEKVEDKKPPRNRERDP